LPGERGVWVDTERTKRLLIVSKRLVIFAAASLILTTILFAATYLSPAHRLMISWLSFECGIIGGFVSIQQRLRKINDEELLLLSQSWTTILVIPVYGGIFSLVLYVLFLSGLIHGPMFPEFYMPVFHDPPVTDDLVALLRTTYPKTGPDFAKLVFWTFVAGFSERLVPQIIQKVSTAGD